MPPELAFILTLVLRMAVTAAFVVSASVITERAGPVIGALVATLPISAGPSYVFLALDHDAAFIAEARWRLLTLPWRGRDERSSLWVGSHRAKQDARRGGVKVSHIERCPN